MMSMRTVGSRALLNEVRRQQKGYKRASVRALNKTATQGRNQSSRTIRKTLNVKAGAAKKLLSVKRANTTTMTSAVRATYKKIPLIKFNGVKELKRGGVSVKVRKDRPPMRLRSAFIATMPSGHRGVFYRKGPKRVRKSGRWKGQLRQPIYEAHGPTVQQVFGEKLPTIVKVTESLLFKILDHELEYELRKQRRRR